VAAAQYAWVQKMPQYFSETPNGMDLLDEPGSRFSESVLWSKRSGRLSPPLSQARLRVPIKTKSGVLLKFMINERSCSGVSPRPGANFA
jgi:hypothetical protein